MVSGSMAPYAAVKNRSGFNLVSSLTVSWLGLLVSIIGMLFCCAHVFTGDGVITCFLPTGLSGCVTTAIGVRLHSFNLFNIGMHSSGVPKKTIRGLLVFIFL